jgi:hypothetical protein
MPLTDTSIKSAKPAEKPVKMTDGEGLYLLIHPNGGKWWRSTTALTERKTLSMGVYPDVSLRSPRQAGRSPGSWPMESTPANTARPTRAPAPMHRQTASKPSPGSGSPRCCPPGRLAMRQDHRRLERDVFPWIGSKPIADLNAPRC